MHLGIGELVIIGGILLMFSPLLLRLQRKTRIVSSLAIIVIITSIYFNYSLYHENERLKTGIGVEHHRNIITIINAVHFEEDIVSFWVDDIKEKDDGFERFVQSLQMYSFQLRNRPTAAEPIAFMLDSIGRQFLELEKAIQAGGNTETQELELKQDIEFFVGVLDEIVIDLGSNYTEWYKEFEEPDTYTRSKLYDAYKAFTSQS